jgi:hypothetical protein
LELPLTLQEGADLEIAKERVDAARDRHHTSVASPGCALGLIPRRYFLGVDSSGANSSVGGRQKLRAPATMRAAPCSAHPRSVGNEPGGPAHDSDRNRPDRGEPSDRTH